MHDEKKEKLLAAGTVLFAKDGYDRVSIRQISEAAGVNSALISYYFGGKQGLYDAVLSEQLASVERFVSKDLSALDPREVIRQYAEEILSVHQKHPHLLPYLFRELASAENPPNSIFQTVAPKLFALLSGALARGVSQGLFRPDLDVPSATILLAGMVNFHYLSRHPRDKMGIASTDAMNEERYLSQAVDVFLRGIERRDPK